VLKISPAALFSGLPFHQNFAIGPFFPKILPAVICLVIFCSYMLVQGAPKSKLLGAREDLNPALAYVIFQQKQV
jgi:hypothetical protein